MTYRICSHIVLGLCVIVGSVWTASAQESSEAEFLRSHEVSEETLEKVAAAYEAIEEIRAEYREEYGNLEEADLPDDVERRLIEEFMAAVEKQGVTWNTYSNVLKSINQDVVLHDRFLGYVGEEIVVESEEPDERQIARGRANGNFREVKAEQMETIPIGSAEEMVGLMPGVEDGLRIRGGSPSSVEFQVDGRSMRDGRTQAPFMGISYTQIEEIHIETGGFNAEYGNARSGVISVKTKGSIDRPTLVPVSNQTLDNIARAYVAVEEIRNKYDISEVRSDSAQKSQQQRQAEFEMGQAIVEQGVDIDTYVEVLEAMDSNSALRQKVLRRIEQVREGSL